MIETVVLNGPPNSGKDFLGEKLAHLLNHDTKVLMFKDGLYAEVAKEFNRGIAKYGPLTFKELATSRATKDVACLEHPEFDMLLTPREALIHVSENILKVEHGKDYLGLALAAKLDAGINIVTDSGFEEELIPVVEASDSVAVVRLTREGCDFEGDSRDYLKDSFLEQFDNVSAVDFHNQGNNPMNMTLNLVEAIIQTSGILDKS